MSTENKETVAVEEPKMCTLKEQVGHALGVLGHDSAYTLWGTWMQPFLTEVVQFPAAALAALLGFARIFDGVNDVAMGFIADKSHGRFGRFRSWILRAGPLFCICVMLSFIVPSDNMTIRIIYASVMYVVVDVVFTAVDIPFWSLPAAMTGNTKERSSIIGTTTTASNAVTGTIGIVLPLMLVRFGGAHQWSSYFKSAVIICGFAIVMYLICFGTVREHVTPDPQQKIDFKLGLKNIYQNKPLLFVQISNVLLLFGLIVRGSFGYYYYSYNYGNLEYMAVASTIGLFTGIGGSLLFIFFIRFMGKRTLMFLYTIVYVASCVVTYFIGWNHIYVFFVCNAICALASNGMMVGVNAMIADTMDYGEWKIGQRNEGVITSTRCFFTKLAAAAGGVLFAAILGITGYANGAAEQSMTVLNGFHFMMSFGSAIITILAVVPMFFYKLTEKRHAEIMAELAARKAAKE